MKDLTVLEKEYSEIKDKYVLEKSINLKEDLKNKLIELDYAFTKNYEYELDTAFPMATTLDKEEKRLEDLIKYVIEKNSIQKERIKEYEKLTNEKIELSYLKYSDNINEFKERLNNVKNILSIINEASNEKNDSKLNLLKSKLIKKDYMNLLYEFCLIDNLDNRDIDLEKIVAKKEVIKELKQEEKVVPPVQEKKVEIPKIKKEVTVKPVETKKEEPQEEKILTTIPQIDKIGSVVPVNIFESLENAETKLPDVVLPTNGLKDSQNDIFLDTKDMFK